MRTRHLIVLALTLIVALGVMYLGLRWTSRLPRASAPAADSTASPPVATGPVVDTSATSPADSSARLAGIIVVESPAAGSLVTSPLTVRGRARGPWYFEAEFPVRLVDANGVVIAAGSARSQTEWTTPDFVPFAATLEFTAPPTAGAGALVLER